MRGSKAHKVDYIEVRVPAWRQNKIKRQILMTKEQASQIERLYKTYSDTELAKMLELKTHCVTDFRHKKGLFKEKKVNPKELSYSEKLFIRENYMKMTYPQMAKQMKRSKTAISCVVKELYAKGFPKKPNESHKMLPSVTYINTKPNKTSFKKGQKPHNTRKVGQVYWRNAEKQWYIKTQTGVKPFKDWLWEQYFGQIEKGKIVCFLDNNKKNVSLENLGLFSRVEILKRNNTTPKAIEKRRESLKKSWARKRFTEINGKNVWS